MFANSSSNESVFPWHLARSAHVRCFSLFKWVGCGSQTAPSMEWHSNSAYRPPGSYSCSGYHNLNPYVVLLSVTWLLVCFVKSCCLDLRLSYKIRHATIEPTIGMRLVFFFFDVGSLLRKACALRLLCFAPKVQTCNDIFTCLVFVRIENLNDSQQKP